jgi:mRNA interferase MazF
MRRGDLVTIALQGDYGKPRPALVVQSDAFIDRHPSLLVCPLTSTHTDAPLFRVAVQPTRETGLRSVSYVMVDRIATTRPERVGAIVGRVDDDTIASVDRALASILGLGE